MTTPKDRPNDRAIARLLAAAQDAYGYLTPQILDDLARSSGAQVGDLLRVYGAIPQVQVRREQRDAVVVCTGKNCANAGAGRLVQLLGRRCWPAKCLGCCDYAPAILKAGRLSRAAGV